MCLVLILENIIRNKMYIYEWSEMLNYSIRYYSVNITERSGWGKLVWTERRNQ